MRQFILIISIILLVTIPIAAESNNSARLNSEEIIKQKLKELNLTNLRQEVEKLNQQTNNYLPPLQINDLLDLFNEQGLKIKITAIIKGLLRYLFDEIIVNSRLLGELVILSLIVAILKTFQFNFSNTEVSKLANGIIYLVLIIIALNSFKVAVVIAQNTITNMVDIMHALLPLLLTLLVSLGSITSATLFHPISFLIVNALSTVVAKVVFPLIFLAAILDIINNISDHYQVTGLASLFKQIGVGLLGVVMTIFMAAIVTQGTIAAVSDGVTIRTAKYLTGSFVPIVGGFVANALDMIVGGSLLIKNALGIFGVLTILIFCSFSVIKIIALVFIYRLAAAIVQPVSDAKIVDCLNRLGNNLLLVFAAVVGVGVMFFTIIIIIVGTANFVVMLR
ncbi:stage III sporulation protein AE [Halanaerobacter jeridensis]|uniref:Stage III sporulation protein AE n=1 Tax=Halanaerobacter jeridensis TaxID=706427 RepID=A0A938XU04_9FIRM|nr:stage III sporulation protein AE [Halanaerobacter jeridensis]MBM7555225.1 stage III sporulation protein AE [Halanaerobacter jeridensis]